MSIEYDEKYANDCPKVIIFPWIEQLWYKTVTLFVSPYALRALHSGFNIKQISVVLDMTKSKYMKELCMSVIIAILKYLE